MTKSINILTAFLLAAGALAASAGGCELIASVDRSKVPGIGGSSTSTGGSTTTTTSTGGTGGMMAGCDAGAACTMPDTCPAQSTKCILDTCSMGCCGTVNAAKGAACADNGTVCDGNGKCVACNMDSDCMATGTMCATATCDMASHTCKTADAMKGATCNDHMGSVCDGMGNCVSPGCNDGTKNDNETDTDCGGGPFMGQPACPPCADGKKCLVGTDCADKVCAAGPKTCSAPTCSDTVQNGNETDVDCGGGPFMGGTACAKCADGKKCLVGSDCMNADCYSPTKTCVSCMDTTKDGDETDVDCGGACAAMASGKCAVGKGCLAASDCATGLCDATFHCATKGNGVMCNGNAECTSTHCVSNICCNSGCTDTCVNGQFTPAGTCNGMGVCGSTAAPCTGGVKCASATMCLMGCMSDTDCQSGSNWCQNPGATGMCVAKVGAGACTANDQCASGLCGLAGSGPNCCSGACLTAGMCGATGCSAANGACQYPDQSMACTANHVCDAAGNCKLAYNQPCSSTNSLCASGVCNLSSFCGCSATIDCPMNYGCKTATAVCLLLAGQACSLPADCLSGVCTANVCG